MRMRERALLTDQFGKLAWEIFITSMWAKSFDQEKLHVFWQILEVFSISLWIGGWGGNIVKIKNYELKSIFFKVSIYVGIIFFSL